MSNYRRLISYIYAYEGQVKGKNIGFVKLESRGGQCKLSVNVKKVYVGGSDLGVYLLAPGKEICLGSIFIRSGAGEFRTVVSVDNAADSGVGMDYCYGLTIHEPSDNWRCYTTIWEDAVAHAAEIELADVTAKNRRNASEDEEIHKKAEEIAAEMDREIASNRGPLEVLPQEVLPQEALPQEVRQEDLPSLEETPEGGSTAAKDSVSAQESDVGELSQENPAASPMDGCEKAGVAALQGEDTETPVEQNLPDGSGMEEEQEEASELRLPSEEQEMEAPAQEVVLQEETVQQVGPQLDVQQSAGVLSGQEEFRQGEPIQDASAQPSPMAGSRQINTSNTSSQAERRVRMSSSQRQINPQPMSSRPDLNRQWGARPQPSQPHQPQPSTHPVQPRQQQPSTQPAPSRQQQPTVPSAQQPVTQPTAPSTPFQAVPRPASSQQPFGATPPMRWRQPADRPPQPSFIPVPKRQPVPAAVPSAENNQMSGRQAERQMEDRVINPLDTAPYSRARAAQAPEGQRRETQLPQKPMQPGAVGTMAPALPPTEAQPTAGVSEPGPRPQPDRQPDAQPKARPQPDRQPDTQPEVRPQPARQQESSQPAARRAIRPGAQPPQRSSAGTMTSPSRPLPVGNPQASPTSARPSADEDAWPSANEATQPSAVQPAGPSMSQPAGPSADPTAGRPAGPIAGQPAGPTADQPARSPASEPLGQPTPPAREPAQPSTQPPSAPPVITETQDDLILGDPMELERLEEEERENTQPRQLWESLRRRYPKIQAFDCNGSCEILTIKPQDIGLLPRETWTYGNNSFLLHGYYNYRYLILAKVDNAGSTGSRYLLGVPGNYYSNEKYMASMFGFPHFVLAKRQPTGNGRFGYWYTDIKLENLN